MPGEDLQQSTLQDTRPLFPVPPSSSGVAWLAPVSVDQMYVLVPGFCQVEQVRLNNNSSKGDRLSPMLRRCGSDGRDDCDVLGNTCSFKKTRNLPSKLETNQRFPTFLRSRNKAKTQRAQVPFGGASASLECVGPADNNQGSGGGAELELMWLVRYYFFCQPRVANALLVVLMVDLRSESVILDAFQ